MEPNLVVNIGRYEPAYQSEAERKFCSSHTREIAAVVKKIIYEGKITSGQESETEQVKKRILAQIAAVKPYPALVDDMIESIICHPQFNQSKVTLDR